MASSRAARRVRRRRGPSSLGATKALRANAALLKKRLQSAPILREDAGEASGSLKSGLKSLSAHGIVAAGQTAKKVTQATGSGAKSAKSGLSGQAGAAAKGAGSTAAHASSGATSLAGNVSGQVKNTAHLRDADRRQVRHELLGQGQDRDRQGQVQVPVRDVLHQE